ncbi:hypothetical protein AAG906_003109 [Vitis piasezkii]
MECPQQVARETRALKEAKDKLQKRVEELTWRLQLEKRLRDSSLALSSPREPQYEEKPQKSLIEKQQVNILFRSSPFFMLIIFSGAGKPRPANQVYFTRSTILWGHAYCCLPDLQIPSPMEVI